MKLNARIRQLLKELNHWHSAEAFEKQGVRADNIKIYEVVSRLGQPSIFMVSHRGYDPKKEGQWGSQQYWYSNFGIRDASGNPTQIGRKIGVQCGDKRISTYSQKGKAIEYFLHRVAWINACRLTNDRSLIEDKTGYGNTSVSRESVAYS